jgi:DNA topoisomerase-3
MTKTVIIAEKPSVAADLARVLGKVASLGKFTKKDDYFENDKAIIASAIGHLVGLKMPTKSDGKKLPWSMSHLPHIPEKFELEPIETTAARFRLLVKLLKQKDVDTVVNACDAGREGELIFRYLIQMADLKRPLTIKRMWMQSMTDGAILEAWNELKDGTELENLANAAICRSESDWLVGLNGTRALTAYNSRHGGFVVTSAGRVQTPTLVILAEREQEIREFVPRTYFEVQATFRVANGNYEARWFREDFKKDDSDPHLRAERIWSETEAAEIVDRCLGKTGIIEEVKKPTRQAPPQLFDLTSLQREAGNKHGFSAQRTLQLAQALYEKYKLLTYPRTDSKFLPDDYLQTVRSTINHFANTNPHTIEGISPHLLTCSKWLMDNDRVVSNRRVFDTTKVSDHFAIIPTEKLPTVKLDDGAAKIYNLVLKRFLAIFYPHAEFEVTQRITRIAADSFRTDGRVLVVPGYLEVYGRTAGKKLDEETADSEENDLVSVKDGESANAIRVESQPKETRPPARFNDSSLLSAMETAGKRVEDEDLRDAMSERGLGTPATRASIIENLIKQKYVFRDEVNKRDLVVSNKGMALVDLLHELDITTLGSPELTGEWEYKLKEMEHGHLSRKVFMDQIKELTREIVAQAKSKIEEKKRQTFPDVNAACPECNAVGMRQTEGTYECKSPDCDFRINKFIAGHMLTSDEFLQLVGDRKIGPFDDLKNRFGQPFTAELSLTKEKKSWKLNFVFEGDDRRDQELRELSDDQIICEVPIAEASNETVKVYEIEGAYVAPALSSKKNPRGIRISKNILRKDIPTEQAIKLFSEGKTDLMAGFVSKKGRPFSAHLTLDRATGKLGWEFAPRPHKKGTAPKKPSDGVSVQESADNNGQFGSDRVQESSSDAKPTKKTNKPSSSKSATKKSAIKKSVAKKSAKKKSAAKKSSSP